MKNEEREQDLDKLAGRVGGYRNRTYDKAAQLPGLTKTAILLP